VIQHGILKNWDVSRGDAAKATTKSVDLHADLEGATVGTVGSREFTLRQAAVPTQEGADRRTNLWKSPKD